MYFYLSCILEVLLFFTSRLSALGSADFTASAVLQGICGSILQLHTLRLAYAANSTLAKPAKQGAYPAESLSSISMLALPTT
jgi:hypothetical protein